MAGIADALRRAAGSVEDFRGDYAELAAMMRASWAEGPNPPYLYTAELLADCFRCPGSSFELAPCIYDDSELVAFVAGCPRRVMTGDVERRILISSFLTVAPADKSSGYGILVWSDLMRRAAEAGFDGVVNYCVDGEAMHRMIDQSCRLLGLPLLRVKSFSYLTRLLPPPGAGSSVPEGAPSADQLVKAAAGLVGEAELCRVWSETEAAWQLSRLGSVSVASGTGANVAVLTGNVLTVADTAATRCLVIDDVLWGDLAAGARPSLVERLVDQGAQQGARYAIVPLLGYADLRPFVSAGFLPVAHTMHAYLTLWSEPVTERPAERYYLDVI